MILSVILFFINSLVKRRSFDLLSMNTVHLNEALNMFESVHKYVSTRILTSIGVILLDGVKRRPAFSLDRSPRRRIQRIPNSVFWPLSPFVHISSRSVGAVETEEIN